MDEFDSFITGIFIGGVLFALCYNNLGVTEKTIQASMHACYTQGSALKVIYPDGDFKCNNGSFNETVEVK